MDEATLSDTLEALADRRTAAARRQHAHPLKGVRGVSDGELARLLAAAWHEEEVVLDRDEGALDRLFAAAFEDGLMAIGLVAAALPDAPDTALDLGLGWLERVDDPQSADALGWFVLGPAALASGRGLAPLIEAARAAGHEAARRAVVSAGLALTPEPLQGPCAAALRERLGERHIRFVDAARAADLTTLADAFLRDESPMVRKALRRVLRAWTADDPAGVASWADAVRGGLPKLLKEEVERARRRAARAARDAEAAGDDDDGDEG
ncbi:MAG: DNA alkylation repair protein [Alphaproteobacteria bacterium]|nr:DNA alkylation repair protein [Alphaproteobacteria bacterium]